MATLSASPAASLRLKGGRAVVACSHEVVYGREEVCGLSWVAFVLEQLAFEWELVACVLVVASQKEEARRLDLVGCVPVVVVISQQEESRRQELMACVLVVTSQQEVVACRL